MNAEWHKAAEQIHHRFLKLAQSKGNLTSDSEILSFLALAICGEAGELANLVKKRWRGDNVEVDMIRDELADIRIYLEHIAHQLGIDLDQACEVKLTKVVTRLDEKERKAAAPDS